MSGADDMSGACSGKEVILSGRFKKREDGV